VTPLEDRRGKQSGKKKKQKKKRKKQKKPTKKTQNKKTPHTTQQKQKKTKKTPKSGDFRETSFRKMQGLALFLLSLRGWEYLVQAN